MIDKREDRIRECGARLILNLGYVQCDHRDSQSHRSAVRAHYNHQLNGLCEDLYEKLRNIPLQYEKIGVSSW